MNWGFSLLLFFLISCSGLNSGRYVKLNSPAELPVIAMKYKTSVAEIKKYNSDLSAGKWIFVPYKAGLMANEPSVVGYYSRGDFIWPVASYRRVSSEFGRRGWRKHKGIDISAPSGTGILAAREGKVIYSGWMRGYGRVVIIKHDKDFHTVYAHNSKNIVSKGERVSKGQKIAKVGRTGNATGNHLHFEIRIKDKAVDPMRYYNESRLAKN